MADPAWMTRFAAFAEVCERSRAKAAGRLEVVSGEEMLEWVRRIVWRRYAGRSIAARMNDRRTLRVASLTAAYVKQVLEAIDDAAPALTVEEEDLLDRALHLLRRKGTN